MPTCSTCSAHISEGFARVFANADGEVLACPNCAATAGIAAEAARRGR